MITPVAIALKEMHDVYDKRGHFFFGDEQADLECNPVKQFPGIRTMLDLYAVLLKCWCRETAYPSMQSEWFPLMRADGQCAITATLVYDMFGGEIYRMRLEDGGTHYFNRINEKFIDLTSEQFEACDIALDYTTGEAMSRDYCATNPDTKKRYHLLQRNIMNYLHQTEEELLTLRLGSGSRVPQVQKLHAEYEIDDNCIIANVHIDEMWSVFQHFVYMHEEPMFFILELPVNADREFPVKPGVVKELHKDVYYIDYLSQEDLILLMIRDGELLFNDGLVNFGIGCQESQDEIMFSKYNVVTIVSKNIEKYHDFFDIHHINRVDNLVTAWDIFDKEHPGEAEVITVNDRNIYDLPKLYDEWGMYLAEERVE